MYTRKLQDRLIELSRNWSVISLTGPRQSGKTTLCKMAFPTYDYVNLEDVAIRSTVQNDTKAFLLSHRNGLIIDEAQYLPEMFSAIQVVVDEDKSLRYVLSGSSDFLLMQNITQSLAGRVAVERLLPFSIEELGDIDTVSTDDLMFSGFFPGVWGDGKTPQEVYDNYLTTYIERDVRQIINIKDRAAFLRFVTVCAGRIGCEFSANSIAGEIGVSYKTIQEWMSILETSYTAFRLFPYYRNIGKRLSKTPKIYFYDVGLACFLLGIENPNQLNRHPLRGALFENMVICDQLKGRYNEGKRNNLFFYRDRSQHEIDLVQEYAMQLRAFEIKSAQSYHPDFSKNLDYFRNLFGEDVISTCIIYNGDSEINTDFNGILNYRHINK